jgi:hypothetical protein
LVSLRPALTKGRCRPGPPSTFGVSPLVKGKLEAFEPFVTQTGSLDLRFPQEWHPWTKSNCGIAVPTEIERRGAFDAIMLVGALVIKFLIPGAYGTE